MKIKYHDNCDELFCVHCKEIIEDGEKYGVVKEKYLGEIEQKIFHLNCLPADSDDDIYLEDENNIDE